MTLVYERRSSTITNPVPSNTSGYELLNWSVPKEMDHFLLYGLGTDQHPNSNYRWVVDDVELPINGSARVGSPFKPYISPSPIFVSGTIFLYINNNNAVQYPNMGDLIDDAYPYECMIYGRLE